MAEPLRLGIIGTGIAARDLHWPALQQLPEEFQIVALCNRTREKAEAFAHLIGQAPRITTDYQELLSWKEVDAVDIALPIVMNAQVTRAALQAGKHVFLEKPIAADMTGGREVVASAREHPDRVLLVAENQRYDERFRLGQRLIASGRIGQPIMLHADLLSPLDQNSPYASTTWRIMPEHLGGYLSDGGVHAVASLHMLGGRIDRVQGMITSFHPDREASDTMLANLHFAAGPIGHLTYSVGVAQWEPSPTRVFGTLGSLTIRDKDVVIATNDGEEVIDLRGAPSPYVLEFEDFYRSVVEGKQPDVTPEDALADLAVIDAAFRSWRDGRTADVVL